MDDGARERLTRGRDHYHAGEYEQAESYLAELAAGDAPFADVFDMLGVIYHQQGRMQDAQQMFERALDINPNYTEAALNLAVTYNDIGKYKEANALYARVMETSKNAPGQLDPFAKGKLANMHADLGAAYNDLGLPDDAVREYERALALCPTFHDIRTRLGTTLREAGNLNAAAREFERVREDRPSYLPARLHLGLVYYGQGRNVEAMAEWQEILVIEPGNKSALMYLAMVGAKPQV